ncbi:hypothetical protein, partial [Succinatimonas hippei]|uniref:hypothetical protein n=1 Tax=Succinatimonas hippei TaxID=626938 RepID=UPI0024911C55
LLDLFFGVPNIAGNTDTIGVSTMSLSPSGPWWSSMIEANKQYQKIDSDVMSLDVPKFDASRANSIYAGSTVRPQSLSVLVLIRL